MPRRRPVFLIAESDLNDPRIVRSPEAEGFGLDAAWADEWHHALHATLTGERSGYYGDFGSLHRWPKPFARRGSTTASWSAHRQRVHGRAPAGLAGYQFVVCTQNHDQVGNRALGERLAALMSPGCLRSPPRSMLDRAVHADAVPGEEWAATPVPVLHRPRRAARAGRQRGPAQRIRRLRMGSRSGARSPGAATFERSKLDWAEVSLPPHAEVLDWYRRLLALRRHLPALADPRLERTDVTFDEDAGMAPGTAG